MTSAVQITAGAFTRHLQKQRFFYQGFSDALEQSLGISPA